MIPNLISLSRPILGGLFVHYAARPVIAVAILCLAGISDGLDGWAARRLGQSSRAGALLDPICDRLFALPVLATLVLVHHVPVWQVAVLVTRDVVNTAGAAWIALVHRDRLPELRARRSGKAVTSLQFWCVVHILLGLPLFAISLAAAAVATLWALVDYAAFFRRLVGTSKSVSTP